MAILQEDTVLVNEGPVAQVMLNRPEHLNALNIDVFQGLLLAFEKLRRRADLRVVTLWSAGDKAFAAGAEVPGMAGLGKRAAAEYFELGHRALRCIETMPVPVIAAVHGHVFGAGLELALACDVIVAAHQSQFGLPEAGLGLIPAFGGITRMLQRVGPGMTRRLVFSGEMIGTEEAVRCGLADKAAPPDQLTEEVQRMDEQIARSAPLAVSQTKALVRAELEQQTLAGLRRGAESCLELFQSVDCEEGLEALMQKRDPAFRGR